MSDFDKKKPNIKSDTEEIYEIPDIVTGGTENKKRKKSEANETYKFGA